MDAENPRGDGDGAAHSTGEGDQSAEKKRLVSLHQIRGHATSLSDMFSEILQESATNNRKAIMFLRLLYGICDYKSVAIFLLDIFLI